MTPKQRAIALCDGWIPGCADQETEAAVEAIKEAIEAIHEAVWVRVEPGQHVAGPCVVWKPEWGFASLERYGFCTVETATRYALVLPPLPEKEVAK